MSNFNPRSHEGSDLTVRNFCILQTLFQSTLPRGERRVTARISWTCGEFQSTLPRGERHGGRERCTGNARFQSTLPRGERRECQQIYPILLGISIHAPTRGATTTSMGSNYLVNISIHAPTRGATNMGTYLYNLAIISIHAPTRGATCVLP